MALDAAGTDKGVGFGVLFVTVIALIIVPSAYMVVEDVKAVGDHGAGFVRDLPGQLRGPDARLEGEGEAGLA